MITFQTEKCAQFFPDIKKILPDHYKELAMDQEDVPLDPNWEEYQKLEELGVLHFFSARKDGELVGYIIGYIKGHIHYQSTKHYFNDIYYITQENRNNGIGWKFFQAHEQDLRRLGVQRVVNFTKCHESHLKMFYAMGYHDQDYVVSKILK